MYRLPVYCNLFVRDITRTLSFCIPGELTVGNFKKVIAASTGVCRAGVCVEGGGATRVVCDLSAWMSMMRACVLWCGGSEHDDLAVGRL